MTTRRIVTALDEEGQSYFRYDGDTPGYLDLGRAIDHEIWVDDPAKPDSTTSQDPVDTDIFNLSPPKGGSVVRVFTFLPNNEISNSPDVIAEAARRFNTADSMDPDNPGMHTTPTIDYGIVLSGEITLELDNGSAHLSTGDVVVQRATPHAWRNTSAHPCTMLFVLISSPSYAD